MELLRDAFIDTTIDTAKLIPFLLLTYIVMEYLERKTEEGSVRILGKAGGWGPLFGAGAGLVPQCGFSAAAASLYSGGVITIGTLLAVFLSTSDEMLPIFISSAVPAGTLVRILGMKLVIAVITGLGIDLFLRLISYRYKTDKHIHQLCQQEHCGCEEEGSLLRSALVHTVNIALFIFVCSFLIALLVEGMGEETVAEVVTGHPYIGILFAGLIGLIPNCAASVMITQLYLSGILGEGQLMAGLLVGAGVGLLVLFRTNRHMNENLKILGILYGLGVGWGMLIQLLY
ncbi:MAG: arsenic efflux protein [Eubacterium sp.]|nr:arsenic efflux protein [Eubacterium sp.]